nr:AraC family transcriptional regulator [Catellatospora sp. TT07R-123]
MARSRSRRPSEVQTVAQRAGYTSEFAFAEAFKRELGVAPAHYRRQSRT